MTISLYNRAPVAITCEHTAQGLLRAHVTDDQQARQYVEHEETIFVELDPDRSPLQTTFTVHTGQAHDAYVWEETASGHIRWDRDASGHSYQTYSPRADATVQVVILASGSPPPAAPPDPSSGQAVLKVKVRKKGDLPL